MPVTFLISCSCGHAVDEHDALGCHDRIGTPHACACRLSRADAIDALIDEERVAQQTRYVAPETVKRP